MPTIYREGKFRFFFNSREENRRHVHVNTTEGTAKFWLEPNIELADSYNIKDFELNRISKIINNKNEDFINAWNRYFQV